MDTQLIVFLFSTGAVVLAEMGDKTQLLAMAFAAKYPAGKVLLGVFAATVLNHALAVAAGNFVTRFDSSQIWIQGAAALSFIFFGLWTIRGDKLAGEENMTTRFGAVVTVAVAFFIAEMGDKTQLATIAIAARFAESPAAVLLGTTTGMLIADGIGIVTGIVLRRKIPERTVKLVSAVAFVIFGLLGSYQTARALGLPLAASALITLALLVLTALAAALINGGEKTNRREEDAPVRTGSPLL
jgi:putative Ca2+/H+ antiporter (TMEM165/GDT1 family)